MPVDTCMHLHARTHAHTCTNAHMHAHLGTHIYTLTHTHTEERMDRYLTSTVVLREEVSFWSVFRRREIKEYAEILFANSKIHACLCSPFKS